MTWGFVAVAGATLVGGYMNAEAQGDAADTAAAAGDRSVEEQRRQFELMQGLLAPYAEGGEESLHAQRNLIGLGGTEEQQAAIDQLQQQPGFLASVQQGEEAILQNASATGGLRGGNVQGALAQFRPQMLASAIQQQYQNLGGITSLGQNAAAMTGNAGMQLGQNVSGIYGDVAANQGAAGIAQAQTYSDTIGSLAGQFAGKTF
tara:strand:- start:30243 stop:30854 length:612 start_codon:yes stop_codon:yes gene_type:complete